MNITAEQKRAILAQLEKTALQPWEIQVPGFNDLSPFDRQAKVELLKKMEADGQLERTAIPGKRTPGPLRLTSKLSR